MVVNKFEKMRSTLHFNYNDKQLPMNHPNHDKLHKLRSVCEHTMERFSSVPMEQRMSIDEQMYATKIGNFLKQYLPNKLHKWGNYLCCVHFASLLTGKDNEPRRLNEPDHRCCFSDSYEIDERISSSCQSYNVP